jgi:hypothetical protein
LFKTNFRKDLSKKSSKNESVSPEQKDLSKEEFEDFIVKSGVKGSFMIYRSSKKDDELGIDEL